MNKKNRTITETVGVVTHNDFDITKRQLVSFEHNNTDYKLNLLSFDGVYTLNIAKFDNPAIQPKAVIKTVFYQGTLHFFYPDKVINIIWHGVLSADGKSVSLDKVKRASPEIQLIGDSVNPIVFNDEIWIFYVYFLQGKEIVSLGCVKYDGTNYKWKQELFAPIELSQLAADNDSLCQIFSIHNNLFVYYLSTDNSTYYSIYYDTVEQKWHDKKNVLPHDPRFGISMVATYNPFDNLVYIFRNSVQDNVPVVLFMTTQDGVAFSDIHIISSGDIRSISDAYFPLSSGSVLSAWLFTKTTVLGPAFVIEYDFKDKVVRKILFNQVNLGLKLSTMFFPQP